MRSVPLHICMNHIFFLKSSTEGHINNRSVSIRKKPCYLSSTLNCTSGELKALEFLTPEYFIVFPASSLAWLIPTMHLSEYSQTTECYWKKYCNGTKSIFVLTRWFYCWGPRMGFTGCILNLLPCPDTLKSALYTWQILCIVGGIKIKDIWLVPGYLYFIIPLSF